MSNEEGGSDDCDFALLLLSMLSKTTLDFQTSRGWNRWHTFHIS